MVLLSVPEIVHFSTFLNLQTTYCYNFMFLKHFYSIIVLNFVAITQSWFSLQVERSILIIKKHFHQGSYY